MQYFFILVFIGIVCLLQGIPKWFRTNSDSYWKKKNEEEFDHRQADLVNDDLEREISSYVEHKENHKAIYEDLKEDLITIYGEDYRRDFNLSLSNSKINREYSDRAKEMAKVILLSRHGFIPSVRKTVGFAVYNDATLRYCKLIEDNIRKAGKNYFMYQEPTWSATKDDPYRGLFTNHNTKMNLYDDQCNVRSKRRLWNTGEQVTTLDEIDKKHPSGIVGKVY